jgi:hypothetical protein
MRLVNKADSFEWRIMDNILGQPTFLLRRMWFSHVFQQETENSERKATPSIVTKQLRQLQVLHEH